MTGWWIAPIVYGCGLVITVVWVMVATRERGLRRIVDDPRYDKYIIGLVFLLWPILWATVITARVLFVVNRPVALKTSQNLDT